MKAFLLRPGLVLIEWPSGHKYGDTGQLSNALVVAYEMHTGKSWRNAGVSYGMLKRRVQLTEVRMDGPMVKSMTFEVTT
jgi:hypothetical protein